MSSTSTVNGVVYHLISQLSETAEQQSDTTDNKEEGEEPVSPAQVPSRSLEDLESTVDQQSEQDASTRLAEFRQRKRTTITPRQKAILEEFYVDGMTSSGMQFTQLHQAASQKTGLSVRSVQVLSLTGVLFAKICSSRTIYICGTNFSYHIMIHEFIFTLVHSSTI